MKIVRGRRRQPDPPLAPATERRLGTSPALDAPRCPAGRSTGSRVWRSGWASLRSALACDEEGAILDACEHGESRTLEAYRNALDDPLPEFVRELVLRQFERVMSTHEAIRECRILRPLRGEVARPGAQAGQQ